MDASHPESEVVWIDGLQGFLALEDEWEALAHDHPSPFVTHALLRCWFEAWGTGRPRVCTIRRDGRLVAALPLQERRGTLISWSNSASGAVIPLSETPEDLDALLGALAVAGWSQLVLRAVPQDDPATRSLEDRLGHVALLHCVPFDDCPVIHTTGSLDDYLATMSQNTRRRTGKHRRKLEREHDVRFTILDTPDDPADRLEAALALEAAGWKGRGGSSILDSPGRIAFHRAVAETFSARGEYVLSEIHVDGRLAAFDLAVLRHRRVYSLITSYDETLGVNYSLGLVLRMAMVEACFERGMLANHLLGRMLEWKTKFAPVAEPTITLRAYRRRPLPVVRYGLRGAVWPHVEGAYNRGQALRAKARAGRGKS